MKKYFISRVSTFALLIAGLFAAPKAGAQQQFDGIFEKDGKFGIQIKKDGRLIQVHKPKFEALKVGIRTTRPEIYFYKKKGKWGVIHVDDYHELAITDTDPEFDSIAPYPTKGYMNGYYFIVQKEKKTAVLGVKPYGGPNHQLSAFFDDIPFDDRIEEHEEALLPVISGNLYGLINLNGQTLLNTEYSGFEKVKVHVFRNYYYYILRKPGSCIAVMDPKSTEQEALQLSGDKMWADKYIFSVKGTDTTVFYLNEFLKMDAFKERDAYLKERDAKIVQEQNRKSNEEAMKRQTESKVLRIVSNYGKTEKIDLADGKSVYVLLDSSGVKCLNTETAGFEYPGLKLIGYWKSDKQVFVKKENGKWLRYPYNKEYESIHAIRNYMAAVDPEGNCTLFSGYGSRSFKVDKNSEVTDYVALENSFHFVYKLNGKYGFTSYTNDGTILKFLPTVFDDIRIIHAFNNNPRMQLIYEGETVNAYHDDITIYLGQASVIKCDLYGMSCGNPQCKNGIIGYTNQTVKGKTTTQKYNNTTVWKDGHLVLADVTIIETTPDKEVKEAEYCTDPIHAVKNVWLVLDAGTGKYKIEKR